MSKHQDSFIARENAICAPNYLPIPVVIARGEGVWLWDIDGNKYLDMMSAYSAVSQGHLHPRLVKAVNEQIKTLTLTSRAYYNDKLCPFLEKLCSLSNMALALPMNTGAEAVETSIKAARRWGYEVKNIPNNKAEIIVAKNNFHGRTTTIISFSSEPDYKKHFGPLTPGFVEVPFGDADALEAAITPNTCAFLVEPIQGEAGIIIPPDGWLKRVRELCNKHKVLLILDEIQSGLGRTGKLFAYEHEDIEPDMLILGKALGGGFVPVSAVLAKQGILDLMGPGSHGSTFGGNPLAAAVGLEALNVIVDEKLSERSEELGHYLMDRLKKIDSPYIKSLHGRGLWIGMEVNSKLKSGRTVCEALLKNGVLSKETHETVVRFAPPLTITKEELDWGLERIEATLKELS
ncbi:MAG TPA: ornithine--oxo-acid transaminase [Opitutae bacterium]|nr:ornithine--oxo-acid transaminase [Opitutae bacterium]|tara:strand:+ start:619 stop:1830 length:1212 start_codon:yes stop_codon:yes gene_type:complete